MALGRVTALAQLVRAPEADRVAGRRRAAAEGLKRAMRAELVEVGLSKDGPGTDEPRRPAAAQTTLDTCDSLTEKAP